MPVCPNCGEKINHLINWCRPFQEWQAYRFSITERGFANYESIDLFRFDNEHDIYECPKCRAELFYTAENAYRFLKREDNERGKLDARNSIDL